MESRTVTLVQVSHGMNVCLLMLQNEVSGVCGYQNRCAEDLIVRSLFFWSQQFGPRDYCTTKQNKKHPIMTDSYDPYWTAVSPFTPQQNGGGLAICTEEMKTYFSSLLSRKVIGVQSDLVGHGVFNVVSLPFPSFIHSYTHLCSGI